jgi:hypothetical protein
MELMFVGGYLVHFTDEMNNLIAVHDIRPPVCITET